LSIGVVYDQELVWAQGFGYANVEQEIEATTQTIYRIASITKLFTSTALLQLRDAGKLQLDDPITRHIPWFKVQHRYPDAPPITIQHLITHTSGLPREAAFPYWTTAEFPTREQVREALAEQETILPTETEWKYSNLAVSLAGEIVAAVSGQEYVAYVQEHILDPLEMGSTFVKTVDAEHPNLAAAYGRRMPDGSREMSPFTDCQGITPAANMATTVEDLARFAMLQFRDESVGGRQVLRGSTLREMHRVHWLDPNWREGWGLGFRVSRNNNKTYVGHGGAVRGYRTHIKICPADKTAVIALTNADDGLPDVYVEKGFQWVVSAILKVVKLVPEKSDPDPNWQLYVGKYQSAWTDAQVMVLNGDLVLIDPSMLNPTANLGKLIPVAEHMFLLECDDGGSNKGEHVVFDVDESGVVQRVTVGQNYLNPVAEW
jgi:CubicO group peptidase (beta-lactamase class C family)